MPQGVKVNIASHPLHSYPAIGHSIFWYSLRLSGLADRIPNKPKLAPDSFFEILPLPGKARKNASFGFVWKIPSNQALFAEIRPLSMPDNGPLWACNRDDFCHIQAPLRPWDRPQERG